MLPSNPNSKSTLLLALVFAGLLASFQTIQLVSSEGPANSTQSPPGVESTTVATTSTTTPAASTTIITTNPPAPTTTVAQPVQQVNGTNQTNNSGQIHQSDGSHSNHLPKLLDGIKSIIDLSYTLSEKTLHWPRNYGFQYTVLNGEVQNGSHYFKSDAINMSIHTGTHLDAPVHFSKTGWTVDLIPLERLIDVRAHIIDLSAKVSQNRTYNFVKSDFIDSKTEKPLVTPNSVALVYTGLSKLYSQGPSAYLGTDTKNISLMQVPGFSKEAAEFLRDLKVYGVGLDAISADSSDKHGPDGSYNPVAHAIFNDANIYILENVGPKLAELVGQDAKIQLVIAPLAIEGGSGSPVRLVAFTVHDDCARSFVGNAATTIPHLPYLTNIMTAISVIVGILIYGRQHSI